MTKVKFICIFCDKESWFDVNLEGYIVKKDDLICDDCLPEEDE
jgi:hypothetical protein